MAKAGELMFLCPGCNKTLPLKSGNMIWETEAVHTNGHGRIREVAEMPIVILCGPCVTDVVADRSGV